MPTYEFVCPAGHTFDKLYRTMSTAPTELPCPECGQPATRKISGGAGLLFKGSGFYITDYGKNGKKGEPRPPASHSSSATHSDKSESAAPKPPAKTPDPAPAAGGSSKPKPKGPAPE